MSQPSSLSYPAWNSSMIAKHSSKSESTTDRGLGGEDGASGVMATMRGSLADTNSSTTRPVLGGTNALPVYRFNTTPHTCRLRSKPTKLQEWQTSRWSNPSGTWMCRTTAKPWLLLSTCRLISWRRRDAHPHSEHAK